MVKEDTMRMRLNPIPASHTQDGKSALDYAREKGIDLMAMKTAADKAVRLVKGIGAKKEGVVYLVILLFSPSPSPPPPSPLAHALTLPTSDNHGGGRLRIRVMRSLTPIPPLMHPHTLTSTTPIHRTVQYEA